MPRRSFAPSRKLRPGPSFSPIRTTPPARGVEPARDHCRLGQAVPDGAVRRGRSLSRVFGRTGVVDRLGGQCARACGSAMTKDFAAQPACGWATRSVRAMPVIEALGETLGRRGASVQHRSGCWRRGGWPIAQLSSRNRSSASPGRRPSWWPEQSSRAGCAGRAVECPLLPRSCRRCGERRERLLQRGVLVRDCTSFGLCRSMCGFRRRVARGRQLCRLLDAWDALTTHGARP